MSAPQNHRRSWRDSWRTYLAVVAISLVVISVGTAWFMAFGAAAKYGRAHGYSHCPTTERGHK